MSLRSRRSLSWRWAAALGIALVAAPIAAGERVLFDFEEGFAFAQVEARDVKVAGAKVDGGSALRIASFHRQEWPGITLKAPKGTWDLSPFEHLALDVKNVGTNEVHVCCRVDNPGADGIVNCVTERIVLKPGEGGTLKVELKRKPPNALRGKLFGMRGYPDGAETGPQTVDPRNVTQLLVFVPRPKADHVFEIDNVRVGGTYVPPKVEEPGRPFFPFIDTFGQYIHTDWPGKTHSLDDMAKCLEAEGKELEEKPGPSGCDLYGGWSEGPTLKATGFFYPAKHEGKWWLVDPEGKLFWSHGIDCVRASDSTPIDERAHWFQDLPGDRPEFKDCWSQQGRVVHGHYAGKQPRCFSFTRANVMRKYGEPWRQRVGQMAHRRLRSWGLNTIANWSDPDIYLMKEPRRTPYCVAVHFGGKELEGSQGYWGKFRDVFDPSFKAALRERMAQEVGTSAKDPWCIGYFVDNELSWGDEVSLAVAALASPPEQAAKKAFLDDLQARHGTIEKLNAAWGTNHASWDALRNHRGAPDKKKAWADLTAFYTRTAEQYFRTCREAVKEVAPDQLYLGCRFAWVNSRAVAAAVKHCDVVSYNFYRRSVAAVRLPVEADTPVIIGEFHFGALDRGMFHTGLVKVANQQERAAAYASYVTGALRNPIIVGTGWFKYMDEPTTGRGLDGENYQIGFLDGCDTPYPETIAACRAVGYELYAIRAGTK